MSDKPTELHAGELLLRAIGKVQVPESRILEDARDVLWSAVASEMLGTGPDGRQATATRGPAGRQEQRRMSMGREDPDS
jgi:hypothetical protein